MKLCMALFVLVFIDTTLYPMRYSKLGTTTRTRTKQVRLTETSLEKYPKPAQVDKQSQDMAKKNKKNIKWDYPRGYRIIIVSNATEQPIKVKMENFGKQDVKVKTKTKKWIQLQTYWEQESEWKPIGPHQFKIFPVPVHYTLPKNESMPSIEYRYDNSYLLVCAGQDQPEQPKEGERLKDKRIHLKKAAVDQAWYRVKLKNNQFKVSQPHQKRVE